MNRTTTIALSGGLALAALAFCANSGFAGSIGDTNSGLNSGVVNGGVGNTSNTNNTNLRQTQANRQTQTNRQNTSVNGNGNITENSPTPVPNVFAPGLAAAGSEVCLGSVSGGGSGAGFGVTIGGTYVDRECQLRLNARTLATLGYPVAARETMCLDEDVRRAMYAAGTPCAVDRNGWASYGSGGWYSQAQQQTYAQAQQQTYAQAQQQSQVAAAPASQPTPASQPATASAPVASSQPESSSDSNCNGVFGTWFNRCGSQKVSEATPTPDPTPTPAKKRIARAKPATQSKEAKAQAKEHEAAATPTTAPTQVAADSAVSATPAEVTLAHGAIH